MPSPFARARRKKDRRRARGGVLTTESMTVRSPGGFLRTAATTLIASAIAASVATAAEYEGASNTGWIWDNQRDCCDEAVALAQQDSAQRCLASGGAPRMPQGLGRGMCEWNARGDALERVYLCTATARVPCQ
jgi:hypothetical protein